MPMVSVILPVHNGLPFLEAAVESVLGQTFADFELISIDDGSSDASASVLDSFATRDARIRVVRQANLGLIKTLNRGIELATAPLVARMDADDVCEPSRLRVQVEFMNANPNVVLLGGAYLLIDDASRPIRTMRPATDDRTLQEQCLLGTQPICHPLAMIRSAALKQIGGYDKQYVAAEDLDLFLRLGEIGQLACVNDVLLRYRQHAGSVSERKQTLQLDNQRRAVEAAFVRRGLSRTFVPPKPWRPTTADQRFRFTLDYGWWALAENFRTTARAYARKAIAQRPWSKEAWVLMAKSLVPK